MMTKENTMTTAEILKEFTDLGMSASFHYADDSGKEWTLANDQKRKAEQLYIQNPDLRPRMEEIAFGFLWSLDTARLIKL
jgi:hypothetical protein